MGIFCQGRRRSPRCAEHEGERYEGNQRMSTEQNPTQKAPADPAKEMQKMAELKPRCPHCGRDLPGMNILSMEMPTPQGGMQWLLPSCPFFAQEDGKAADGGEPCGKIISAQFTGYTQPKIARPGGGWPGH